MRGDSLLGLAMPLERDDFFLLSTFGAGFEVVSMDRAEEDDPDPPRGLVLERLEPIVLEEAHD